MPSDRPLTLAVRAVLLAEWDPIGVRDEPEARDEYDAYAPALVRLLGEGAEADVLARHLIRIETEDMGLPPRPDRARRVAETLLALTA